MDGEVDEEATEEAEVVVVATEGADTAAAGMQDGAHEVVETGGKLSPPFLLSARSCST